MHIHNMVNRGFLLKGYLNTVLPYCACTQKSVQAGMALPPSDLDILKMCLNRNYRLIVIGKEKPIPLFRVGCRNSLTEVHSELMLCIRNRPEEDRGREWP